MKTLKLIALAAFALLFSQCKTSTPTAPSGPMSSVLEVHAVLDSAQLKFLQFADQTNGNPWQAIELTALWLQSQPNVDLAYSMDSTYITIVLKSGLQTSFSFDQQDDSGYSIFRGGGGNRSSGEPILNVAGSHSKNTIENKKVLLFAADTKTLPAIEPQLKKTADRITNSGLGLEVTLLRDGQCSYGVVEHFGDYGLVIMDTHGLRDRFLVGSTLDLSNSPKSEDALKTTVTAQIDAGAYNKLSTGSLSMGSKVKANPKKPNWQKSVIPKENRDLYFTSKYLNLLPAMPNTVIFGNMCFSGWSATSVTIPERKGNYSDGKPYDFPARTESIDAIEAAFMNRNLISYYGYGKDIPYIGGSRSVEDNFAAQMEDNLVSRLIEKLDSTGISYLSADNKTEYFDPPHPEFRLKDNLYFKHFGADDYSYDKGCVTQFTDARDGHIYKAVCIGKQNWMAENLNYDVPGSLYSDSSQANRNTYGRFYFWNDMMAGSGASNANPSGVQGICPKGWHIPSAAEWDQLVAFVGGASVAGKALKSTSPLWLYADISGKTHPGGGSNSSGFNALPGGWINTDFSNPGGFIGGQFNFNATFHTASELHPIVIDGIQMNGGQDGTQWFTFYTDQHLQDSKQVSALPCRCLKD